LCTDKKYRVNLAKTKTARVENMKKNESLRSGAAKHTWRVMLT